MVGGGEHLRCTTPPPPSYLSLTCSAVLRSLRALLPPVGHAPSDAARHPLGLRPAVSLCGRPGVSRRCNGLVACRHQRRWDLWIDDRWLPFQRRLPGVSQVRVPPSSGACRACGLPPGACMPQPGHAPRGMPVPCGGPGVGENSGGIRDGLGGFVRYAGRVLQGRVLRHPFRYTFYPPAALAWRDRGHRSGCAIAPRASRRRVVSG